MFKHLTFLRMADTKPSRLECKRPDGRKPCRAIKQIHFVSQDNRLHSRFQHGSSINRQTKPLSSPMQPPRLRQYGRQIFSVLTLVRPFLELPESTRYESQALPAMEPRRSALCFGLRSLDGLHLHCPEFLHLHCLFRSRGLLDLRQQLRTVVMQKDVNNRKR